MNTRIAVVAALAVLPLVAVWLPAHAQEGPPPHHPGPGFHGGPEGPPPPPGDFPPEERPSPGPRDAGPGAEFMAEVMMARMSKELQLSDEQTVLMVRRFSELREKVKNLRKQRADTTRELDQLLQKQNADASKSQTLLRTVMELDDQIVSERRMAFEAISKDLDPVRQARLYLFLDRFENDMRRMIGEARERFQGRRPNGPPPRDGGPRPGDEFGPPPGPGGERGPRPDGPRPPRGDGPGHPPYGGPPPPPEEF